MDNQEPEKLKTIKKSEQPETSQLSKKALLAGAFLAFFPLTGAWGIHDIITKRYKYGIVHMIPATVIYITFMLYFLIPNLFTPQFINLFFGASGVFMVISYIWSIIEGVQMLYDRHPEEEIAHDDKPTIASTNSTASLNTHDTTYYKAGSLDNAKRKMAEEELKKQQANPKYRIKAYPIISFITALIPGVYWMLCWLPPIQSHNSTLQDFPGHLGLFILIYCCFPIGGILTLISVGFGIVGLKTKLRKLAIISLSIWLFYILSIIVWLIAR